MVFQDDLKNTILVAKNYVGCYAAKLVDRADYGDNIDCPEEKLVLLTTLIEVAEFYYCFNYNDNGTITSPDYTCLTYAQAQQLVASIKALMK